MRTRMGNPAYGVIATALMKTEEFLKQHPVAQDETVVDWCRRNPVEVRRVVPSNRHKQLARLMGTYP